MAERVSFFRAQPVTPAATHSARAMSRASCRLRGAIRAGCIHQADAARHPPSASTPAMARGMPGVCPKSCAKKRDANAPTAIVAAATRMGERSMERLGDVHSGQASAVAIQDESLKAVASGLSIDHRADHDGKTDE